MNVEIQFSEGTWVQPGGEKKNFQGFLKSEWDLNFPLKTSSKREKKWASTSLPCRIFLFIKSCSSTVTWGTAVYHETQEQHIDYIFQGLERNKQTPFWMCELLWGFIKTIITRFNASRSLQIKSQSLTRSPLSSSDWTEWKTVSAISQAQPRVKWRSGRIVARHLAQRDEG